MSQFKFIYVNGYFMKIWRLSTINNIYVINSYFYFFIIKYELYRLHPLQGGSIVHHLKICLKKMSRLSDTRFLHFYLLLKPPCIEYKLYYRKQFSIISNDIWQIPDCYFIIEVVHEFYILSFKYHPKFMRCSH